MLGAPGEHVCARLAGCGSAWRRSAKPLKRNMTDTLAHTLMERSGSANPDASAAQMRTSADFVVNGTSLLQAFIKADGGHADFMGRFVVGHSEANHSAADELLARTLPEASKRYALLYICAECGDIGCGAYAARVKRNAESYGWADFVYVNGYEPPRPIPNVGPFLFAAKEYEHAIAAASSL